MRIQSTVAGAAFALAAVTLAAGGRAQTPSAATAVTFFGDIRPILQAHCTICHSPGGPSPMPLVSYDDVLPWARKIKESSLSRRMPIWHAARGYGAFSNDPTLTPYELERIVTWVDGTATDRPVAGHTVAEGADVHPAGTSMTLRVASGWITGWTFLPGDPLITSATLTSDDGSPIGVWVAGDRTTRLPEGSAIRIIAPVHVEIRRRERTGYETAYTPRESSLRFSRLPSLTDAQSPPAQSPATPIRRVRIERVTCGGSVGPADASLIGIRPLLAAGASAHVTVERIGGAQPALVGWFREFDPNYPRIYWLDRPVDFVANARLTSDAPCELDLVLSSRR
jgi:mono/diheme cytochrome c family protein